jgi:hypothetical protein
MALVALGTLSARAQEAPAPAAAAEETAAPESDPRVLEARESFRLAAELARAGRWDEARQAFVRSGELKPHPVTTYNVAFCNRAVGDLPWALRLFQQALDEHTRGTLGRLPDDLVARAEQYRAEVAARVARVTLVLGGDASVLVDGHQLESFEFRGQQLYLAGQQETDAKLPARPVVLISPGTHVFVAKRQGQADLVETRTLGAGERMEVKLEAAAPGPTPGRPRPQETPAKAPTSGGSNTLAWVLGSTGVAALGVGAGFGVASLMAYDKAEEECPRHTGCGSSAIDASDKAETYAWVSNIGLGVGLVGIAASAYLFLSAPGEEQHSRARGPRVLVAASPQYSFIGLSVSADP